ncbi:MAG: hypothetical protein HC921_14555 [Synechococcaceae cyanobacterium SM2_3_1]|nr:hypothetical protein [Synechococcaceae cyanobacterium SM2_3_1]
MQLERQGTTVIFRRLFFPQLFNSEAVYFAASFWSQALDLGGVSQLSGPGLGQACVIIRNRLQPGRPELTRSTGCTPLRCLPPLCRSIRFHSPPAALP